MDTTKPPLECAACGEPIWLRDPMTMRTATDDETGKLVAGPLVYHTECARRAGFVS